MSVQERLHDLDIVLPSPTRPVAAFVPFVRTTELVFMSGHIAKKDGKPWVGRLGWDVTADEGRLAARGIAIDLLGTMVAAGDLEHVKQIVKLTVLVNSAADFTEQPYVADGASELLREVFGSKGAHARTAFGVQQLPFGSCVEIDLIAEFEKGA